MKWVDDHYCFACGKDNPDGLKLEFTVKDKKIHTEYVFPKKYQGYADVVHGGMISLLMDELMVNLPWKLYNVPVVSVEFTIRLKKPVKIGEKLSFVGEIEKEHKNLIYTKSEAMCNNEVVATATAKCFKILI